MKIKASHLALPLLGGAIAAAFVPVEYWDNSKAVILTALSVIGAGVLVRLARGLPFSNADQFEVAEARKIAAATKQSIRALRMLMMVILGTMTLLVTIKGLVGVTVAIRPVASAEINVIASGILGLLLGYILVRISTVIKGDVSLVDLQTDFFVKAVERKQGERFARIQERSKNSAPAANPPGYGKILQ